MNTNLQQRELVALDDADLELVQGGVFGKLIMYALDKLADAYADTGYCGTDGRYHLS